MTRKAARVGAQVHSITSVRRALSEDVDARSRRYAFSMVVRTVCVLVAIVVPGPWRWAAIAGAVLIPLVAVLVANAGRELPTTGTTVDPRGSQDLVPAAAYGAPTSAAERAAAEWQARAAQRVPAHAPVARPAARPTARPADGRAHPTVIDIDLREDRSS